MSNNGEPIDYISPEEDRVEIPGSQPNKRQEKQMRKTRNPNINFAQLNSVGF